MKQALLILVTAFALAGVGCGSKSSGGGAASTPTDPGANGGNGGWSQCQPFQLWNETHGCLNPGSCPTGYGYNPADGHCYPGTIGAGILSGNYDNGVTITNVSKYREMLSDMGRCYQSHCPTENWAYLSMTIYGDNHYGYGGPSQAGWQTMIGGYNQSSAFHLQYGYNSMAPQGRSVRINVVSAGGYYGSNINVVFYDYAHPKQNGFEVRVNGVGHTPAYNERITFKFTYANSARTQLNMEMVYKGTVVAQGTINKQ